MLTDIDFPKSEEYRTGAEYDPLTFYMESLVESTRLDLLLGYFSSSAISVLSVGFAKFISNGGRVRLIINHILSEQDKDGGADRVNGKCSNILVSGRGLRIPTPGAG